MKSGRRVWIIDDDDIHQFIAKRMLMNADPSQIIECFPNGKKALDQLKNVIHTAEVPDLILLDINMPVMDGWGFLEAYKDLRQSSGFKLNIYIVSSSVHTDDITRGEQSGEIRDYLFKPLDLNTVKNLLQRLNRHAA